MHRTSAAAAAFCACLCGSALGAVNDSPAIPTTSMPQIVLPNDSDEYSVLVARAAAEDRSLDFHALRLAWLKSKAHKAINVNETELESDLFDAARSGDDARVRDAAVKVLSVDYINMFAHAVLRQACTKLHDDACAEQHHFVELGLLNSITTSGDGKTCKTGWEVVAIREEYFIVHMLGSTPLDQALVNGADGACDMLNVTGPDGKQQVYYFRIDAVLQDEMGMLKH